MIAFGAAPLHAAPADAKWKGAAFEGDRASLVRLAAAGARVVRVYRQSDAWVLDEQGFLHRCDRAPHL